MKHIHKIANLKNSGITFAKSLLPCSIAYSQVLGIQIWTFWRIPFAYHTSFESFPNSQLILDFTHFFFLVLT